LKREVEDGREIYVKSEGVAAESDDLAVLAKKLAVAGRENVGGRGSGTERVAKAVYGSTFKIYAGEQRRGNAFLAVAQQAPGLFSVLDVAREEDHACGLEACEHRTEARRHLRAVEADDEKLTGVGFVRGCTFAQLLPP
jgi:hypothetical protein